jgi:hypothetical protein
MRERRPIRGMSSDILPPGTDIGDFRVKLTHALPAFFIAGSFGLVLSSSVRANDPWNAPPANISSVHAWSVAMGNVCFDGPDSNIQIVAQVTPHVTGVTDPSLQVTFSPSPLYTVTDPGTYAELDTFVQPSNSTAIGSVFNLNFTPTYSAAYCNTFLPTNVTLTVVPGLTTNASTVLYGMFNEIWWFDGNDISGYQTHLTVTDNDPSGAPYTWTISGDGSIGFDGHSGVTTLTTSTNTVSIVTTQLPTSSSISTITVARTDGLQSFPLYILSMTPHSIQPNAQWGPSGIVDSPFTLQTGYTGYESDLYYQIYDQFGQALPNTAVPLNEYFDAPQTADLSGESWSVAPPGGALQYPNKMWDRIYYAALNGTNAVWPLPQQPQSPLGSTAVQHWPGHWSVGSLTPGSGVVVQNDTWQEYRDHARHTNIASPVP